MPDAPPAPVAELTDHEKTWGNQLQTCRRCNPLGVLRLAHLYTICPDCDGSGWTKWAALASEPWNEIVQNLYIGGHDYVVDTDHGRELRNVFPEDSFDVVMSAYDRPGQHPSTETEHWQVLFADAVLTDKMIHKALGAGILAAERVWEGKKVLVRCQAGLNRSSLIAGIALIDLGFSGVDAVQIIRNRRSPWALCNDTYAEWLASGAAQQALVEVNTTQGAK